MSYEFLISYRQLTHRKGNGFISLISFISIAGIAIGVMALIVVLSVMSGFDRELKTKIIGANPHILIVKDGGIEETDNVIAAIASLGRNDIITAVPYVEGQSLLRSSQNAIGSVIKGLASDDASIEGIQPYVKQGTLQTLFVSPPERTTSLDEEEEANPPVGYVALGYQLAQVLGVEVGSEISIIAPSFEKERRILPRRAKTRTFIVGAIFDFGMNTLDSSLAIINIAQAQELFNLQGKTSGVAIRLKDVFQADVVKKVIQERVGHPYWAQSWIDANKSFFAALKVEKNVMAILLFLIILVAGFNIVSTLIMVVMEKTKDIGILKALGATEAAIMQIFILQGGIVGMVGVICGAVAGLLVTVNLNTIADAIKQTTGFEVFPSDVYYFSKIPTEINPHDIVLIVISAFVIALVAGLYPARRAASLNPVEALRYE